MLRSSLSHPLPPRTLAPAVGDKAVGPVAAVVAFGGGPSGRSGVGFLNRVFGGGDGGGPGEAYDRCGRCGRPVRVGEEAVTVTANRERFDGEAVTVLESEVLLLLCAPCGQRLDAGALRSVIPVSGQRGER
jgi:hypothetical protein